jgi:hypothetical protein
VSVSEGIEKSLSCLIESLVVSSRFYMSFRCDLSVLSVSVPRDFWNIIPTW